LKKTILYILILSNLLALAQQDIEIIKEDFDNDGLKEELLIYHYLDNVDYAVITYENGSKKCTLNVSPNISAPTLINMVPLCDEFLLPKYQKLADAIYGYIFKTTMTRTKTSTLEWILDVYKTKQSISNNKYFVSYAMFKPKIQPILYTDPSSSRVIIEGELAKRINSSHKKTDSTKKSWCIFDAEKLVEARQITKFNLNSDWPQFIDSIRNGRIYKTGHSIYIETDSTHQIIFVSDGVLYDNIQKIAWESIQQISTYEDYILVLTHPYPAIENKLFLIDRKKGEILEFKKESLMDFPNDFRFIESFEVIEDELFLFLKETPNYAEVKEKSIPFILIKKSIESIPEIEIKHSR